MGARRNARYTLPVLKYRLIFGPLLIITFLLLIWLDDQLDRVLLSGWLRDLFGGREHLPRGLVLWIVFLAILPLAAREITAILSAKGLRTRLWLTTFASIAGMCAIYCVPAALSGHHANAILMTTLAGVFVLSLVTFSRGRNTEGVVAATGGVLLAFTYLGVFAGFLLAIRSWHSAWWLVGIIMTTKMCDTGAYFTGRAIGRHKLIPWLSPGKTREGFAGGLAVAMLVGALFALASEWLPNERDHVTLTMGLLAGFVFGLVGQAGDLTMSLFKRDAGIKDSSTIIPGLGGVMDVLDSPLLVAPAAYWLLVRGG